jgi:hypothetical protein
VPDIADVTAELAAIWPAHAAALARDTAAGTAAGSAAALSSSQVVNPDVLAAMIALSAAVPEAVRSACDAIGEPWQHRDMAGCLRQVPRLASRMRDLGQAANERALERTAAGWLRTAKRALGLRRPDVPVGYDCPYAGASPGTHPGARALYSAGDEGFLRHGGGGLRVEWVSAPVIWCASEHCGASWPLDQWPLLGRLLRTPAMVTT